MSFGSGKGFGGGVGPSVGDHPASATDGALDLYVDGDSGDDANSGTQSEPLATITEAESRIPDIVNDPVTVWVQPAASTYEMATFRDRTLRDSIYVVGAQGNDTFHFTELLGSTASDGTGGDLDRLIEVSGSSFGVNTFRGKTVEILTGAAAGDRRLVAENDDDSITVSLEFSAAVGAGDTFRVVEPSVDVEMPAVLSETTPGAASITAVAGVKERHLPGLCLINLHIDGFAKDDDFAALGLTYFYGVDLEGIGIAFGWTTLNSGAFSVGTDSVDTSDNAIASIGPVFGAASNTSWRGWGFGAKDTLDFPLFSTCKMRIVGLVIDRFLVEDSACLVQGFRVFNGGVRGFADNEIRLQNGWTSIGGEAFSEIVGTLGWGIRLTDRCWAILEKVDVTGDPALRVADRALVRVSQARLTGDVGARVEAGGSIQFVGGNLTVTSTDSDTRVLDAGAPIDQALADYTASGDYIAGGDGSVIQRV